MIDLRQDPKYSRYISLLGWESLSVGGSNIYIKKLPLSFAIAKLQRPITKVDISKLKKVLKKNRLTYLLIEPANVEQEKYYLKKGLKKINNPSLPTKTIRFDLLKSEKKLLSEMHSKARYNIGLSKRRGVTIQKSKDINKFSEFWQECSKSWGMRFSQEREISSLFKAFSDDSTILEAKIDEELIAAVFLVSTIDTTYYMYAASNVKGNKLHAPSFLVWKSMLHAKKRNKKLFDFGGIYDERFPLRKWKGFTEFKRKFGGKVISYPGPLRKFYFSM